MENFEIEKKFLLMDTKKDYTDRKIGLELYNEVLRHGKEIKQGYIANSPKNAPLIAAMIWDFGMVINFRFDNVRLRETDGEYFYATIKGKGKIKQREEEVEISRANFKKYWSASIHRRVIKKRLVKKINNRLFEIDAFTDRFLLLAEKEVSSEALLFMVPKIGKDVSNNSKYSNKNLAK